MPNRSKCNDPRSWNIWRLAGAVPCSMQLALDIDLHIFEAIKKIDGVVIIGRDLYLKKTDARKQLSSLLRQNGYRIENLRKDDYRKREGVSVEEMEKKGWSLWFAAYPEFYHPLRPSMSIFEAWHWAPLPRSPELHERIIHAARMVSRCDYYYQDGRPAFGGSAVTEMRLFVEHFTQLKLDEWDEMVRRASRSGPGMIRAIAMLCHPQAEIEDRPNIGNLLVGLSKIMTGKRLTGGEVTTMRSAAADPVTREQFDSILESRPRRTR